MINEDNVIINTPEKELETEPQNIPQGEKPFINPNPGYGYVDPVTGESETKPAIKTEPVSGERGIRSEVITPLKEGVKVEREDVNFLGTIIYGGKPLNPEGFTFRTQFVNSLPSVGENGVIYLVPKEDSETNDEYDEFIWNSQESKFELVGSTQISLEAITQLVQTAVDSVLWVGTEQQYDAIQEKDPNVFYYVEEATE